ncbi:thioredoxin domain-containing protein [Rummeliibacillus stabekisii]|uniref:thioredoxin domain-containing protein n=1 Tax=Rummeliibacillus stabekisii TaxID=241244 RepID=UPI00371A07F9
MPNEKKANRLINETSPYLLQHAYNPVNWYPWGEEAFTVAKEEDKPVLVSIGYSTCHWCHVMAHESFEDEEVAFLLNKWFICIKVDREERPDIDSIYMNVCQMMTGSGGWPLNVFLTPDQKPYFAGTYFSKYSMYKRPGMMEILPYLAKAYHKERDRVDEVGAQIMDALSDLSKPEKSAIHEEAAGKAYGQLKQGYDNVYGGFGTEPKFPNPSQLLYLLRYYNMTGEKKALEMATKTLNAIYRGGIYDHIGFGFARYSTDRMWLVPHFEKMLYDQALLIQCYTEAYQITKDEKYKQIVYETINFIKREMQHPEGGFYSAIDADSEGVEGKYYTWDYDEVIDILGPELGKAFAEDYDVTLDGNFEEVNIPNLIHTKNRKLTKEKQEKCRLKLLEAREKRVYPHVDDKILTAWNTLLIASLAKAGGVFEEKSFIELAQKADAFLQKNVVKENELYVSYREQKVSQPGFLDDYANYLWALNELYLATGKNEYLKRAHHMADQTIENFHDDEHGAFFLTSHAASPLLVREKTAIDNAYPVGNSTLAVQMFRLGKLLEDDKYRNLGDEILQTFASDINRYPGGTFWLLQALLAYQAPSSEIHINNPTRGIKNALFSFYRPFDVWHIKDKGPFEMQICEDYACQLAIHNEEEALKKLGPTNIAD